MNAISTIALQRGVRRRRPGDFLCIESTEYQEFTCSLLRRIMMGNPGSAGAGQSNSMRRWERKPIRHGHY